MYALNPTAKCRYVLQMEVDGLLIDCWRIGFLKDVLALRINKYDEAGFPLDEFAEGVVLAFEIHFGLNDLASSWDVAASDLLVAVEVFEHA